MTSTQMRNALKKWFPNGGYEFYSGWETRGRPGGVQPAGFVIHHTGGAYTDSDAYMKFLFVTGRPAEGIPGPLCQFAIGGSGRLYIGALGRANHAGSGDLETRQKVGAENYPGYTSEMKPNDNNWLSGNGQYYGVEICYPGTLPMKPAQYSTAVRLAAMIISHYGWTALSTFAHREHSTRKIDPGKITLYQFRKDVRALLISEGDDDFMGFINNQEDFNKAMSLWWNKVMETSGGPTGKTPETMRLRAVPIQQMIGRVQSDGSFINVHTVMGYVYQLAKSFGINNPDGPHPLLDALLAANDDIQVQQVLDALEQITIEEPVNP